MAGLRNLMMLGNETLVDGWLASNAILGVALKSGRVLESGVSEFGRLQSSAGGCSSMLSLNGADGSWMIDRISGPGSFPLGQPSSPGDSQTAEGPSNTFMSLLLGHQVLVTGPDFTETRPEPTVLAMIESREFTSQACWSWDFRPIDRGLCDHSKQGDRRETSRWPGEAVVFATSNSVSPDHNLCVGVGLENESFGLSHSKRFLALIIFIFVVCIQSSVRTHFH
ncbi:MAG: hypothetical protein WCJ40_06070 [Planctomycetota bacterium]